MADSPSASQLRVFEQSRRTTIVALSQVDDSSLMQLSRLTLPEIDSIKQEIAQVFPAGNLPAFVLSGLLKLKGREITPNQVKQDLSALMRGLNLMPQGLYSLFVAGPATVLYAYQKLLQLAGKDPASAFPQGTWQFYLQFSLREDTARHANETIGFQQALANAPSEPVKMAAAWVCAVLELIHAYDAILALDWAERVTLRTLTEEATAAGLATRAPFASLTKDWNKQRPYSPPPDDSNYVIWRETTFRHFIQERLSVLPAEAQRHFQQCYQARLARELSAYQEQMTVLAALEPDRYQEQRNVIPLWQATLAFIWQGHTYLLPVCRYDEQGRLLCFPSGSGTEPIPLYALPDGQLCDSEHRPLETDRSGRVFRREDGRLVGHLHPPAPQTVLGWLEALFGSPALGQPSGLDLQLAASPRALQPQLRKSLPQTTQAELALLRRAPIIINWDCVASDDKAGGRRLPLACIRQNRRGIGDHALTIFRTDQSMVFDQSHIFFDGMWGLAVAEMLTNNATRWYHRLDSYHPAPLVATPLPLGLASSPEAEALIRAQPPRGEATAESEEVDAHRLFRLCQWLRQRGVQITVNDLLLLYRSFHAAWYQPAPFLQQASKNLGDTPQAQAVAKSIETYLARSHETNPALLIPMDASNVSPKERIFPTTFRNPLTDIQTRFIEAQKSYLEYRQSHDSDHWAAFDQARREFLAYLKAFGELLDALKAVTMRGESFNTATIRLLAHLPGSMQHLLDQVPQHIGVLNEIIKGNEVFSNVGRVAPGASLTRFISAKDDGQTKELVWGVISDNQDRMHLSLRDFRPFVSQLVELGQADLADRLAQDYLDSYVKGLNRFVTELGALITLKAPDPV